MMSHEPKQDRLPVLLAEQSMGEEEGLGWVLMRAVEHLSKFEDIHPRELTIRFTSNQGSLDMTVMGVENFYHIYLDKLLDSDPGLYTGEPFEL